MTKRFLTFVLLLFFLASCTNARRGPQSLEMTEPEHVGVYHKVHKGETIWRIAKAYNISINDIVSANHIPNVAQVEENQLLFIPGALAVKEIPQETDDTNDFIWPINGKIVSYFHDRDGHQINKGVNIQGKEGAFVKAARRGEVVFADYLTGYGHVIIVDHKDGFYTVYAQNEKLLVKLGDHIRQGEQIAQLGNQKDLTYLNFQVRKNGIEDNPFYYLPRQSF